MRFRFRYNSYRITRDGDRVTITDAITGDVIGEHTMGATTITGRSPVLSDDDRREIHAALRRAELAANGAMQ